LSVGINLVPNDFTPSDALEALKKEGLGDAASVVDRLVASTVIERRLIGGIPILRFSLDPAAEYLAAIRAILSFRSPNISTVEQQLMKITSVPGYPKDCEGYLRAYAACYRAYQRELRLGDPSFPW